MARKIAPIQIIRRITLGLALVGLTIMTILHQRSSAIPSVDALDPFGGLETLLKFIAGGELIKKLEPGTLVLFGGTVLLAVLVSRFFCGWFCAFGALQGVFGWLGKKIFGRRFTLPRKLDSLLRLLKYPILVAIVYFTWQAGALVIRPYDPLAAYGHLSAGLEALWAEFAVGLVLLIATLFLSLFYERVFCKYLCPLGAFNALLGRIPLFRIKREASTCISCSKCDRVCPMNVEASTTATINSPECISCLECVSVCPTKKPSLLATLGGKAVKPALVILLGLGIYLVAAGVGQASGMLRFTPVSLKEQAASGTLRVEDIKGSSTYEAVAESFGIELERLYRELGLDPRKVPSSAMLKDTGKLAGIDGFEADAVRVAVAKILGLPYEGEGGDSPALPSTSMTATAAPSSSEAKEAEAKAETKPAASAPVEKKAEPAPAAAQSAPAAARPAPAAVPAAQSAPAAALSLSVPADFNLEGTMSIREVAAALGASEEAVIAKLELPGDIPRDKPLRDLKDSYGYTMPVLKERIKK